MHEITPYDDDVYAWSREQASVLREMTARRDLPNALDLSNIAEEIEDLGISHRAQVESFLRLILVHLIKAACSRSDEPKQHWRSEVTSFQIDLVARYSRSMARDIDMERIWRLALRHAEAALREYDEVIPPNLRLDCPYELDDFVRDEFDPDEMSARLSARSAST